MPAGIGWGAKMTLLECSPEDEVALIALEEMMWREESRFDMQFMQCALAPDFFEFGRSGRTYTRKQSLAMPREPINARFPLQNVAVRMLDHNIAQVAYDSAVTYDGVVEHARRSSLWSRTADGWELRFHQGTPFTPADF